MAGELEIVASASLGGLGAKDGPATIYNYAPPSLIPVFLPWMGVLLLLLLPANRSGQAWWVWLPLLAFNALEPIGRLLFTELPAQVLDMFGLCYGSLAFGLTGLWLAASFFTRRSRWLAFLGMLVVMMAVGGLAGLLRVGQDEGTAEAVVLLVFLAFCVFQIALTLTLAGLMCRRSYGPWRFAVWAAVFQAAGWLACAAPFALLSGALEGGLSMSEMLAGSLVLAGTTFVVLLPFLLLMLWVPFYRERLAGLLQLPIPTRPPVMLEPVALAAPGLPQD